MSKIIKENLIILSSWTRDREAYKKLIDSAPSNWQVFVPSYRELKPYKGIEIFEKNLLKFLEINKLSKVNLLGHSLGGALALHFAANYKNKLKGLFIVDAKGLYNSESIILELYNFCKERYKRSLNEHLGFFRRLLSDPISNFRLGLLAHNADFKKEAATIKVDTAIFWGENDSIVPLSQGQKLKNLIPNSKLFILKGMGHDWIFDNHMYFWERIEG